MNILRAAAVSVVAITTLALSACEGTNGPQYNVIGLPCSGDKDCSGLSCVDVGGGTCQTQCRAGVDAAVSCSAGSACEARNRYGSTGKVDVCVACSGTTCGGNAGTGGSGGGHDGGARHDGAVGHDGAARDR